MSKIIESYKEYFERQDEESIDLLFDVLLNYDFSFYKKDMEEVAIISLQCRSLFIDEPVILYTNGSSSGIRNPYKFKPNFFKWASCIEPFLRGVTSEKNIFLCCRLGAGSPPQKLIISEAKNNKRHYDAFGNLLEENQIRDLFEFAKKISGKVSFSAFPDVWNMLFSNPLFNSLCDENREKIGCFVNSDFEMFFTNKNFYTRDQMINWKSGLNFYTCKAGYKHFLPIFHINSGCFNLINLDGKIDDSDIVGISEEQVLCKCGRKRMPMEILFHHKNAPKDHDGKPINFKPLKDLLKGRYATFQVHQDENNKITVLLTPVGAIEDDDLSAIKLFFSNFELSIEFNKYFQVGSKRYCFWRSRHIEIKKFELH